MNRMSRVGRWALATAVVFGVPIHALAAQVWPKTTYLRPHGACRGTTVKVEIHGTNLGDARELLIRSAPGYPASTSRDIEVLALQSVKDSTVLATLRVAPDARLGTRQLRVRTTRGVSGIELFRIGTRPHVAEREDNDAPERAQVVALESCIDGSLQSGDIDWFEVDVDRPIRLRLEVLGVRLGDAPIDPRLLIVDADGVQVSDVDDTVFGRMDPVAHVDVDRPGRVRFAVRDTGWRGATAGADYCVVVGTFARPRLSHPLAVRPGTTATLRLLGDGPDSDENGVNEIRVPSDALERSGGLGLLAVHPFTTSNLPWSTRIESPARVAPTPLHVRVSDLATTFESDGEDDAVSPSVPCAFEGCIERPREADRLRFRGKKGDRLRIQVVARALRSPLDAVISIRKPRDRVIASSDDTGTSVDPVLDVTLPSDGDYEVTVTDRIRSGGPLHRYRVEIDRVQRRPYARLLPPGRNEDHAISTPRGGRAGFLVVTSGLDAGTRCRLEGLPPGCSSAECTIERGASILGFVIHARPDAELAYASLGFSVAPPGEDTWKPLRIWQVSDLVRVTNNQPYLRTIETELPMSVVEDLPFGIEVVAPPEPLARGGAISLSVHAKPDKGFGETLRLRVLQTPPGISAGTTSLRASDGRGAKLELRANESAAIGACGIHIMARVYGRGGFYECASDVVTLRVVAKPATEVGTK
ncbi:MAG: hypothetical protein H6832_06115 [Planctomycetes bacterium]|nr:hypothetical protein [Planctomycetota bacterium]MCB9917961.1 hypothetical protein [Planctomycetota bacterium]